MKKVFLLLFFVSLFLPFSNLSKAKTANLSQTKTAKTSNFGEKIKEFLALLIDIFIKFFQLLQEFLGLIIQFFSWLKSLLLSGS